MKFVKSVALAAMSFATSAAIAAPAQAVAPPSDALGRCIVRSTSQADRQALVRWVFVALAEHPDLNGVITVDAAKRVEAEKRAGKLFERLLAEDCVAEFRASIKEPGDGGAGAAFRQVGELAMGGITEEPAVRASLARLMQNVDMNRVMQALMKP